MITKNLKHLPILLVNRAIVEFYGFSEDVYHNDSATIINLP